MHKCTCLSCWISFPVEFRKRLKTMRMRCTVACGAVNYHQLSKTKLYCGYVSSNLFWSITDFGGFARDQHTNNKNLPWVIMPPCGMQRFVISTLMPNDAFPASSIRSPLPKYVFWIWSIPRANSNGRSGSMMLDKPSPFSVMDDWGPCCLAN